MGSELCREDSERRITPTIGKDVEDLVISDMLQRTWRVVRIRAR